MIEAPGIYPDIPEDEYHGADICPAPSLSSNIIKHLVFGSPLHAWTAHPALNPAYERAEAERFDIGRAAHALLLEGEDRMIVVEANDWRTKAAKEARDAARAQGMLPVLPHQRDDILAMARKAKAALAATPETQDVLAESQAEATLVWKEGELWCKARPDLMGNELLIDYKSTENASPDQWSRNKLVELGCDIQAAWYLRGRHALTRKDADFVFLVQETSQPYECSLVGVSQAMLELGRQKVEIGLSIWHRCMLTGQWPGYPRQICWTDPQPWHETKLEERRAFSELLGGQA